MENHQKGNPPVMGAPLDPNGLQDPFGLIASSLWNPPDDAGLGDDPYGLTASGLPPWSATAQDAIAKALFDQKITTLAGQLDLHPQVLTKALHGVPPEHWQPVVDALMQQQPKDPQPIVGVGGIR
jgi:hypothetical protein